MKLTAKKLVLTGIAVLTMASISACGSGTTAETTAATEAEVTTEATTEAVDSEDASAEESSEEVEAASLEDAEAVTEEATTAAN